MWRPGAGAVTRCRACGADVPGRAERCPNCGAPQGDSTPCPHCNCKAGTSPNAEFRRVCDICGGPRIPMLGGTTRRRGSEVPLLKEAQKGRKGRAIWRGVAIASGLVATGTFLLFAVLALLSVKFLMVGLVFTAPLVALLVYALMTAKAKGRTIAPALDGAWLMAATEVARQQGRPLAANDLSRALGVDGPKAEELVAEVEVNASLGDLGPRMRIDASAGRPPVAEDNGEFDEATEDPKLRRRL